MTAEELAVLFHDTYERLSTDFGYTTRQDTRKFNPDSPNGRLMIATCKEVLEVFATENTRLRQMVSDLQSGMYVNCVYCGYRYGPVGETPVAMADVLKAHIETCPKHPMSKIKRERDALLDLGKRAWRLSTMAAASQRRNRRAFLADLLDRVEVFQDRCKELRGLGLDVTNAGKGTMPMERRDKDFI